MTLGRVISGIPRPVSVSPVTITAWGAPAVIAQGSTDAFGTLDFRLSNIDSAVAWGALFQQYKIRKAEVFFRPMFRANAALATPIFLPPLIYVAVDVNDGSSWSAITQAERAAGCVTRDDSAGFGLEFQPRTAMALYAGSFSAYAEAPEVWIDTGDATVRHYGMKWAVLGAGIGSSTEQQWNVTTRFTVTFRLPR